MINRNLTKNLLDRIYNSPTCYHVIENIRNQLTSNGYTELSEQNLWNIEHGGKYFVIRNDSSIIAFRIPKQLNGGFSISAAHSDSPTFKLKENPEKRGQHYVQINTEKYGGMLMSTWFDRPLSIAGRLFFKENGKLNKKLVNIDKDLLIIPNLAIHMNRNANDGYKYNASIDTLPLYGGKNSPDIIELAAEYANISKNSILGSDLFLYCRNKGSFLGVNNEFISSPKLDDLECAFGCIEGFLSAKESDSIPVCCIFDNEEVGSSTIQGAASTFLRDTLRRISLSLKQTEEEFQIMLSRSFLVSADNAHAQHPNHPEYSDSNNCPYINEGIVIKFNAARKYATDGRSCAIFRSICEKAEIPIQVMSNRSDLPGGSTLGSIAGTLVPVNTVDIGLPQLSMHSAYETAGSYDYLCLISAMAQYFSAESEIFSI